MRDSMAETLSGLEVEVLRLYVEGKSYQEIGEQLGRHAKSIDNALQRVKRKLDTHLQREAGLSIDADLVLSSTGMRRWAIRRVSSVGRAPLL